MKIAIVLPVYNESERIDNVLKELKKKNLPIFIVDDGSADQTSLVLKANQKLNSKIKIYTHYINLGKGAALKTGCEAAFGAGMDGVIMMDSDGQHSPEDLNKFIEKLNTRRYDMVLGSRDLRTGAPWIRLAGNWFASTVILVLFNLNITDILCGFRAMTRKGYKKINIESRGYGIETEMIVKASKYNLKYCEVPIKTIYYDKHKGVTILDAFSILADVFRWRIIL